MCHEKDKSADEAKQQDNYPFTEIYHEEIQPPPVKF
jgi:hypothetical protein